MVSAIRRFRFCPSLHCRHLQYASEQWPELSLDTLTVIWPSPYPVQRTTYCVSSASWTLRTLRFSKNSSEFLVSGLRSGLSSVCGYSLVTTTLRFSPLVLFSSGWFGAFVMRFMLTTLLTRLVEFCPFLVGHLSLEMNDAIRALVLV